LRCYHLIGAFLDNAKGCVLFKNTAKHS